jgi:hypothetical protein
LCIKFVGVDWNPSCMILGTYDMNTSLFQSLDAMLIGFR